jgi:hypothetical protein
LRGFGRSCGGEKHITNVIKTLHLPPLAFIKKRAKQEITKGKYA